MLNFIAGFLGSRTLSLAIRLVPLLGRAFDKSKTVEWIYDKIEDKFPNMTEAEFKDLVAKGQAFIAACHAAVHS